MLLVKLISNEVIQTNPVAVPVPRNLDATMGEVMNLSTAFQGKLYPKRIQVVDVGAVREYRLGVTAKTTMSSLVCVAIIGCCQPNDPNCRNTSIGPSGAEIAGVAIGVGAGIGAIIAVEVHHAHHTLNGVVVDSPSGKQLRTHSGNTLYLLSGSTASIPAGHRVSLHGTAVKQPKDGTGDRTFVVERMTKDYGPTK